MARVLFLKPDFLKKTTVIDENVDEKLLTVIIEDAQNIRIHQLLGTPLYDKLKADVLASTLTGDYKTLMDDYITIALAKWCTHEASFSMSVKYNNKGVVKKNAEFAQPVDYTERRDASDYWESKAEWYSQRLVDYLCENQALYPEYTESLDGDDIRPVHNAYSCNIFLGSNNAKRYIDNDE